MEGVRTLVVNKSGYVLASIGILLLLLMLPSVNCVTDYKASVNYTFKEQKIVFTFNGPPYVTNKVTTFLLANSGCTLYSMKYPASTDGFSLIPKGKLISLSYPNVPCTGDYGFQIMPSSEYTDKDGVLQEPCYDEFRAIGGSKTCPDAIVSLKITKKGAPKCSELNARDICKMKPMPSPTYLPLIPPSGVSDKSVASTSKPSNDTTLRSPKMKEVNDEDEFPEKIVIYVAVALVVVVVLAVGIVFAIVVIIRRRRSNDEPSSDNVLQERRTLIAERTPAVDLTADDDMLPTNV